MKRLLVVLAFALAGCAAIANLFGVPAPQTPGQNLVQAYGDATKGDALAKALHASVPPVINQVTRDGVHAAAKTVHDAIDAYWDTRAQWVACEANLPAPVGATSGTAAVDPCGAAPNAQAVAASIDSSLKNIATFLAAHPGGK